jgi:hypothetical protein
VCGIAAASMPVSTIPEKWLNQYTSNNHLTSRFEIPTCPKGHGLSSNDIIISESCPKTVRGSPSLVGRGIAKAESSFSEFENYLKSQNRKNKRQILCYVRRYGTVLETGDASTIVSLSSGHKRRHVMEAITVYSKYAGCYDKWNALRKQYSLKWTTGNESLQAMERFFNPELSLEKMIDKVKHMIQVLPRPMALVVRHALLTGLRPTEAVESARLIQNDKTFKDYYDPKSEVLSHFKFKDQFVRNTKKAWISYITLDDLQPIRVLGSKTPT